MKSISNSCWYEELFSFSNYWFKTSNRYQIDNISFEKIHLFEEYRYDPANARIFVVLIKHRQTEIKWGGNKVTESKVI